MPEQRIDWKILARRLHYRIGVCKSLVAMSEITGRDASYENCRIRVAHEQDAKELLRPDNA